MSADDQDLSETSMPEGNENNPQQQGKLGDKPGTEDDGKILRPHNDLRNIYEMRTLLVIAAEGSLKVPDDLRTFTEGDPRVNVRYTSKLPLPNFDKHPPVDAIALMIKVFCEDSFITIKKCLPLIDARYFAGKCFILAFSDFEFNEGNIPNICKLAEQYHLPLHYAIKKKGMPQKGVHARLQVPQRLLSIYCPPVGCDVSTATIMAALSQPIL
ncbi:hypothetical protein EGW08_014332 [Elysia chlorotica]|uniref:Centromere protein M n=1 Tax=Elysia chlorotica TaxID=188477 RepID=A0A3S0ZFU2_ELYCH|nr:hypothetical protein EGW08_014332 [Elysia chlorotica]